MIIKFNSTGMNTVGDFDYQGVIITVDILVSPSTLGYRTVDSETGDSRIVTGDYIFKSNGTVKVYKAIDYIANGGNNLTNEAVRRGVGDDLIKEVITAIKNLPVAFTNDRKANIGNTIGVSLWLAERGELVLGRAQANNTATNADYTASVKSGLISIFDTHIAKL